MKKLWINFIFSISALGFISNAMGDVSVYNYNCPYNVPISLVCAGPWSCFNPTGTQLIAPGHIYPFPNTCSGCTMFGLDFPVNVNNTPTGKYIHLWISHPGGDCQCYDCPDGSATPPSLKPGQGTPNSGQKTVPQS